MMLIPAGSCFVTTSSSGLDEAVQALLVDDAIVSVSKGYIKTNEFYYDLLGRRMNSPSGLTIVVTRFSDGSVRTEKKLFY